MSRAMIPIVLAIVLNTIMISHHAMAFTIRFGSVPVSENPASIDRAADADIPTPQLLNMAVGANGATFGPTALDPDAARILPAVRIRRQVQSPVVSAQPTTPTRRKTLPRQLSGPELMLLRHAEQVAKRSIK